MSGSDGRFDDKDGDSIELRAVSWPQPFGSFLMGSGASVDASKAERLFRACDLDDDGELAKEEMRMALAGATHQFHSSEWLENSGADHVFLQEITCFSLLLVAFPLLFHWFFDRPQ